jgi:hypothetical protein
MRGRGCQGIENSTLSGANEHAIPKCRVGAVSQSSGKRCDIQWFEQRARVSVVHSIEQFFGEGMQVFLGTR